VWLMRLPGSVWRRRPAAAWEAIGNMGTESASREAQPAGKRTFRQRTGIASRRMLGWEEERKIIRSGKGL